MASRASPFVFATLTQPKRARHLEQPRAAVERIVRAWKRMTDTHGALGRRFREYFAGGLRTVEVTYSRRGERQHNGGRRTQFSGYHAHLHVLLEVAEGVDRSIAMYELREMWLEAQPDATASAQCIRAAAVADAHQLCKYVTKPLELVAGNDAVLRELFAGLHGLRLLQAFGCWLGRAEREGWRSWGPQQEREGPAAMPRWRGPEIGELLRWSIERLRTPGCSPRVAFTRPDGEERWVDANEAWSMIEAACAARLSARGPPDRILA